MPKLLLCYISLFLLNVALVSYSPNSLAREPQVIKIGFGSCAKQDRPQKVWQQIQAQTPDLFIFAGDNVYIDSAESAAMQHAYAQLANNPNFKSFRQSTPIIATWDDHDYGMRDGDKTFVGKETAKLAFIDFWDYPELKQLKTKPQGIYHAYWHEQNGKNIQVIMLDTRWYRDKMALSELSEKQRLQLQIGPYKPHTDPSKTLLGEIQWEWLAYELKKPADFRVVVSSIAVLAEHTGWDSWANYPHEQNRLLTLLDEINQDNILILSGDIHKAEISQREFNKKIYTDVSSSGLDAPIYPAAPNKYRYGRPLLDNNFGLLELSGEDNLFATVTIFNAKGESKLTISLGGE